MPVDLTAKTRRGYLTIGELEEFADITVTDQDEALDQIQMAEELIDNYVGFQEKFFPREMLGHVSSASSNTIVDGTPTTFITWNNDYFVGCEVEIVGGTGVGQRRKVLSSDQSTRTLTMTEVWTVVPDTTSIWKIRQVGKFPRRSDSHIDTVALRYYKTIPEAVTRAVAAQVAYMISQGEDFFNSDNPDKNSEQIGNYSYSKGGAAGAGGMSADAKMIGPRVRGLLRGIVRRGGQLKVSNPTGV